MPELPNNTPFVSVFPCLSDNYGFLLYDPDSKETVCIDTPNANTILDHAKKLNLTITQIWNTHWHPDHAGGNQAIKDATNCKIYGPEEVATRLNAPVDVIVRDGDTVQIGKFTANVIATPGHTLQHISYYLPDEKIAFVGDTFFSLGCGRMFEGDPQMFWHSLSRLRDLPDDTLVYCAHEYTEANLKFAESLNTPNPTLSAFAEQIRALRKLNLSTIPTKLGDEKANNPFLRADIIHTELGTEAGAATFAKLRTMKDSF